MRVLFPIAAAAALLLGFASPAHARAFQVKAGISGVLPDESAKITTIGGGVKISDEWVPSLQLEYLFNDNVSVELLCCVARHDVKAVGTSLGTVNLGKVSHFPPTVTLKYRWTNFGKIEPYVGAGVNYTMFYDEKLPAGPVTSIKYDDSFGGALQAGADFRLDDHWFANVDVRKIWISTNVDIHAGATLIKADVDINPVVVSTGIGYRF
jgi:outer membrane protein